MKTVSFRGTQLTASERKRLEQQQQLKKAFLSPALQELSKEIETALEARKEQGAKPERTWFPHFKETGTPYVGDCFHF